jgi:hypothetical protein
LTLPSTHGFVVAGRNEFGFQGAQREIVIALKQDGIVTFSDDGVVPDGLHGCFLLGLRVKSLSVQAGLLRRAGINLYLWRKNPRDWRLKFNK